MIKNNFHVITGGPGSGKSTLISHLNVMGYEFADDTARNIIKERLQNGLPPRPEPREFARQAFEKDFGNFISRMSVLSTVFFDRSFLDSAGMICGTDKNYFDNSIKELLSTHRFNRQIFIMEPWKEIYLTDDERDHTFEHATAVYDGSYKWYDKNNYELVIIPKDTIENRAKFVIKNIDKKY